MMGGRGWRWTIVASMLWLAAACHEEGHIRVASLTIDGNHAVATSAIQSVMVTRASGRLPWSPAAPFDRDAFEQDLARIRQLYDARGFPNARVTALDADLNEKGDAIRLRITIDEGEPVRVDDVRFVGFDVLSEQGQARVRRSALESGEPRDRARMAETERLAREALVNNGYPYATVSVEEAPGASPGGVIITVTATPGTRATFGDITIVGNQQVTDDVVHRYLTFAPGETFSQSDIVRSERRLGSLDILQFANINARTPDGTQLERIPVVVTVAEEPPRRLELRAGYGTEDRVRGLIEWSHLNFLGDVRRLTATGAWSSIDRGVRVSLTQPYLFVPNLSLDARASSWWTGERVYTSDVQGGRIGVSYRIGMGEGRPGARTPSDVIRGAYVVERMRYTVRPEVLEDLTNVETLIALGLDPTTGQGRGTMAAISLDYERSATDNVANPRRGYGLALSWEEARPWLGGTFDYRKTMAEGRGYVPIGRTVIATRARVGTIVAETDADAPFSERFFLGGSTSLRGWGRYQISPLRDGIPVGGRTMLDASFEWRVPVRDPLSAVLFVDTGNVWSESLAARTSGLHSNAGIGLRYATPVGLVRMDLGYQMNRIEGLLVNGDPESRRWRLHFSIGQAF